MITNSFLSNVFYFVDGRSHLNFLFIQKVSQAMDCDWNRGFRFNLFYLIDVIKISLRF
jgi:hypothetical protein